MIHLGALSKHVLTSIRKGISRRISDVYFSDHGFAAPKCLCKFSSMSFLAHMCEIQAQWKEISFSFFDRFGIQFEWRSENDDDIDAAFMTHWRQAIETTTFRDRCNTLYQYRMQIRQNLLACVRNLVSWNITAWWPSNIGYDRKFWILPQIFFDDEEWRIITLFVNHLDSQLKYTDLFAASCGSLGEFTDIKQSEEGYAMTRQMKHFNFPVRNPDGTFYAQVHPFDPSFFAVKVHPSGALLFTPHHSQLTLLQHIIIQAPFLKKPVQFLDDTPKYWLEDDGTMCLHPSHRWKSDDTIAWLRKRGLHSVPKSIKAEIGDLVYNGPKQKNDDSTASTPPPGRFVYFTGSRASNDPPPGL